jgi:hypothetical protein
LPRPNPLDLSRAQRDCLPDAVAYLEEIGALIVTRLPGTDQVTLQPTPALLELIKECGLSTALSLLQTLRS